MVRSRLGGVQSGKFVVEYFFFLQSAFDEFHNRRVDHRRTSAQICFKGARVADIFFEYCCCISPFAGPSTVTRFTGENRNKRKGGHLFFYQPEFIDKKEVVLGTRSEEKETPACIAVLLQRTYHAPDGRDPAAPRHKKKR